jgi:hypothetical protein
MKPSGANTAASAAYIRSSFTPGANSVSKPINVPVHEHRRIRELERELRRKEKALAEAAALLVLRKKAEAIWGRDADE